jgi:hypothetical protein
MQVCYRLLVMLAGLILPGVAFEYRSKTEQMRWIWDLSFAGGSFAATQQYALAIDDPGKILLTLVDLPGEVVVHGIGLEGDAYLARDGGFAGFALAQVTFGAILALVILEALDDLVLPIGMDELKTQFLRFLPSPTRRTHNVKSTDSLPPVADMRAFSASTSRFSALAIFFTSASVYS